MYTAIRVLCMHFVLFQCIIKQYEFTQDTSFDLLNRPKSFILIYR